jgi:carbon storage regulator
MLVLTRRVGEVIAIGDDVEVMVVRIEGDHVRLGVKAPVATAVHGAEIRARIDAEKAKGGGA